MRKNSMDMGQVLQQKQWDPEMKRAEMQMEKVQGEEMVQAAETWKKPRQQMNTAGSAGKVVSWNVHKKKGN